LVIVLSVLRFTDSDYSCFEWMFAWRAYKRNKCRLKNSYQVENTSISYITDKYDWHHVYFHDR